MYSALFRAFYRPHRIAQMAISTALRDRAACTKERFFSAHVDSYDDILEEFITGEMILEAVGLVITMVANSFI